jgi:fumarate hydratase class I
MAQGEASTLEAGEMVLLSGRIVTGRDRVHRHLASGMASPVDLRGLVIYHCGPVAVKGAHGGFRITAAGPTTSMREEPYEAEVISRFAPGAVMGKGGMGERTAGALARHGCAYLHVTGGAAACLAGCIEAVEGVHLVEFGLPEAMWVLLVRDLPALVTMDSRGASLHRDIRKLSEERLKGLFEKRFTPART